MKRKILVTGGAGMVGGVVSEVFADYEVLLTGVKKDGEIESMDILDNESVEKTMLEFAPDVVLHLAAITDLEFCEKNEDFTFEVNAKATQKLAENAKKVQAKFVYVSTANVFGGYKKSFFESDQKKPLNVYAKSKLKGEVLLEKTMDDFCIVRAGWMVGKNNIRDKKFLGKIVGVLKKNPEKISVVNDTFGSLTFADELLDDIKWMIKHKKRGVFHSACIDLVTRYDMVQHATKLMNVSTKINAVGSDHFKTSYFVDRPTYEGLLSEDKEMKVRNNRKKWQKGIKRYLHNLQ
jgi:dTDP-4-dehydrorhamnose reductase